MPTRGAPSCAVLGRRTGIPSLYHGGTATGVQGGGAGGGMCLGRPGRHGCWGQRHTVAPAAVTLIGIVAPAAGSQDCPRASTFTVI